jgi:DNA-binding NtrC family response regulator
MTSSARIQVKRAGRTILVVDDDAAILHCVRRILEQANYIVLTSRSGDHAIDRGQTRVDPVLTDIVMPGSIDGLTLTAKIPPKRVETPGFVYDGRSAGGRRGPRGDHRGKVTATKAVLP